MAYFVYHFQVFMLVLIRMNVMFSVAPFFSSDIIPFRVRAIVSFLVAIVIFPTISAKGYYISGNMGEYFLMVVREVAIGLYLGFLIGLIFSAFQLAAQFFSLQLGFGMSEVLDPLSQISIPVLGQLFNLIALLVFLYIGGHHFLIQAVYRSYELAPVMTFNIETMGKLFQFLASSFTEMFSVALRISLPILSILFLLTISMGVLAKAAPQMNILMLGLPINVTISYGLLIIVSPMIIKLIRVALERSFDIMNRVLFNWPVVG